MARRQPDWTRPHLAVPLEYRVTYNDSHRPKGWTLIAVHAGGALTVRRYMRKKHG